MARSSIAASKLELKALEAQLRDLIDKRNARVQILDDFNDLYHLRLGPLMSRILELRKQLAVSMQRKQEAEIKRREKDYQSCLQFISGRGSTGNAKTAVDRIECRLARSGGHPSANPAADGVNHRVAGGNSRAGGGFFPSGRQRIPPGAGKCGTGLSPVPEQQQEAQFRYARDQRLSADERNELKRLWRQASRLCHPDVVADELKEKAHQMMVQLNQARQNADLAAIRALLTQLQSGLEPMMASDRLNNRNICAIKYASSARKSTRC